MERSEVAAKMAERLGWAWHPQWYGTGGFGSDEDRTGFPFPPPDAPLHEHLAFVGRVLEAVKPQNFYFGFFDKAKRHVISINQSHTGMRGELDPSLAVALAVIGEEV